MRKSDGTYTYFVPDVAYHVDKWERGFTQGDQRAGHATTTARSRACAPACRRLGVGIPPGYPDYVLHKMVTVMSGGEEVKISKRAGSYVTVRDLIDEAGRDAVRFFLVSRKADTEFIFDIDLARSQTDENPVYYVQYAHARVARCCGRPASRSRRRRIDARRCRPRAAREPRRGRAAAQARRLSRGARAAARDLAPHVADVLPQGFGRAIPQLL